MVGGVHTRTVQNRCLTHKNDKVCKYCFPAFILNPRIRYSWSVTEKPYVMVLAGPKGHKPARRAASYIEVGPVGPIDF